MNRVIRFFETLQRMFYWAWKMRSNYDWDYGYVEQMMLLKLKRLLHAMETSPWHRNLNYLYEALPTETGFDRENTIQCIKAHRALILCVRILERRTDSDAYYRISGLQAFYEKNPIDIENINSVESRERFVASRPMIESMDRMEARDKKFLYDLLYKYSEGWWT